MLDLETAPPSRLPLALESATQEHARVAQEERCAWLAFVWSREDDLEFASNWRQWLSTNERLCASAAHLWELRIAVLMGGAAGASDPPPDIKPLRDQAGASQAVS